MDTGLKAYFPGMNVNFNAVEFGGYVSNNDPKTTIHPPMGSGEFLHEGYGKAAYFRNIELIRDPYGGFEIVTKEEVSLYDDVSPCYIIGEKAYLPGSPDGYIFTMEDLGELIAILLNHSFRFFIFFFYFFLS